jgi:hypothetical protein
MPDTSVSTFIRSLPSTEAMHTPHIPQRLVFTTARSKINPLTPNESQYYLQHSNSWLTLLITHTANAKHKSTYWYDKLCGNQDKSSRLIGSAALRTNSRSVLHVLLRRYTANDTALLPAWHYTSVFLASNANHITVRSRTIYLHWFSVPTSRIRDGHIPENHFTLHSIVSKQMNVSFQIRLSWYRRLVSEV